MKTETEMKAEMKAEMKTDCEDMNRMELEETINRYKRSSITLDKDRFEERLPYLREYIEYSYELFYKYYRYRPKV